MMMIIITITTMFGSMDEGNQCPSQPPPTSSPSYQSVVHDHHQVEVGGNTGSQVKRLPLPIVARHSGSSRLVGGSYRLVAVHGSRALA